MIRFICFDIVDFLPFHQSNLLNKALDFASAYDTITNDERNIVTHAKNSILIHKQHTWQKKGDTTFDVTMGSFDGAETCELVGSFLLSQLQDLDVDIGLYRGRSSHFQRHTERHREHQEANMPHFQSERPTYHN